MRTVFYLLGTDLIILLDNDFKTNIYDTINPFIVVWWIGFIILFIKMDFKEINKK